MEAIETAVDRVLADTIKLQPEISIPVLRADETTETQSFAAIVVSSKRELTPFHINTGGNNVDKFSVEIELRSIAQTENSETQADVWQIIERALKSDGDGGLDYSRFQLFIVQDGASAEQEVDADGRKKRKRTFSILAQEV